MPPTHQSQIETFISRLPQSAYGTARTAGDDYRRILNNSQTVADLNTTFADDASYDAGSDLANDIWAVTNNSTLPLTPDFCFQDAPFLIHDALGGYSVSGPDGGLYTHVQTPQSMNSSRQLPVRTVGKKYGGIGLYIFRDMRLLSLAISGGTTDRIKMNAQYQGSGHYAIDPASYASPAIVADREWAYSGQVFGGVSLNATVFGVNQVETATAAGTVSGSGNATVVFTSANISAAQTLSVAVTATDTPSVWAAKVRTALRANRVITTRFIITGSGASIIATDRVKAANDGTLNISLDNGTCTGITTAASSANTTAGVAGDYQNYTCDLETWSLNLDNPQEGDGYRQCSDYLVAGDPKSGSLRAEDLVGARNWTFDWTARMQSTDKARGWMKAGSELTLDLLIAGIETNDHSTRINHNKLRIIEAKEITGAGGNFIGVSGKARLMATSGAIGLTITTVNGVASYVS